jgi:H+/Cl- antiporter ClcA
MNETAESDSKRIVQWMGLICFFLLMPPVILYLTYFILKMLGGLATNVSPSPNTVKFLDDIPMITLAFYSGAVGSVVSYIYGRTNLNAQTDPVIRKMAKLLFGGALGVVAFFFSSSALIIKLLYPKLAIDQISNAGGISYESVILLSFVAGLIGPAIVRGVQRKSETVADSLGNARNQRKIPGSK